MCTGIVESTPIDGSGKGPKGWFKIEQVNVSYDHPIDAPFEHALNIDFVDARDSMARRIAVELSPKSAKTLANAILATLARAEAQGLVRKHGSEA